VNNNNDDNARLYVGNLPYSIRTDDLFKLFADFGKVVDAIVMMESGSQDRSKGFGFVTMSTAEEAEKAAAEMNGKDFSGRAIVCNIAKPRAPKFSF
jgi:cold-inducible RNA-binding protein